MLRSRFRSGWFPMTLVGLAVACAPGDDGAIDLDGPAAFVTRLGSDTVAVETYTRTDTRIEGELIERFPYTYRITYAVDLNPDGTFRRLEAENRTPPENPDGPAPQSWVTTIENGTATVERTGGRNPGTNSFEVEAGALPTLGRATIAFFALEQALRQAEAAGGGELPLQLIYPTRPQPVRNAISPWAADTIAYDYFGTAFKVWSSEGQLMGADGINSTMKSRAERVASLDMDALASTWAEMDTRGEGIGTPSPGATTAATLSGATIEIAYSQPAKRGRDIWGALVPYGEVWRTGANAATIFTTDRDLTIGDVEVPAGTYTLWSTYTADTQQLIINSQSGQRGTAYNADNDFATTDMTRSSLPGTLERFTISLEETSGGGVMHLDWDQTRFSVPIQVR